MALFHIDELSGRVRGTLNRIMRGIVHGIVRAAGGRKPEMEVEMEVVEMEEDSATHDESRGLSALSEDDVRNIFWQACNPLEPRVAVAFSSASRELWALTQAQRLQLRSEHKAAAALCHKMVIRIGRNAGRSLRCCKTLREARVVECDDRRLSVAEMAMLGTLGPVLPWLEEMRLSNRLTPLDGVQRLVAGLGAGALPAMTTLAIYNLHVGDAGASALAAALGRGAVPRLENLTLCKAAIGDAGLVALAPALRRLPALKELYLMSNLFGDEGLAALVAPPPPLAGALPLPQGGLTKLKKLDLVSDHTQITDAGCAALISAFFSGTLPALRLDLEKLVLRGTPASAAAQTAVQTGRSDFDLLSPEQVHLFEQLVGSN